MNIFLRELKANRKALIIWSVCMFLLVLSGMGKYTAYSAGGDAAKVFKDIPATMKAVLGMGSLDVTTMSGYFAMLFIYTELAVAIHAVLLGTHIIAKEECDKTTEFLLIKPISRASVVTSKLLAALFNVVVVNIVTLISSLALVPVYNKGADISGEVTLCILSMFLIQLLFLSLGAALAAILRNPKSSGSLGTGLLLVAYVIARITDMTTRLNFLNLLSPFKYFNINDLAAGKELNLGIALITLVLVAIFSGSTYFFYQKRDLNV